MILYIKQGIKYIATNSDIDDMITIQVKLDDGETILFTSIYRSPSTDLQYARRINQVIKDLHEGKQHNYNIVCGDFNYPRIDWENCTSVGEKENEFIETIRDCYLTQLILHPTRGRGLNKATTLDLLLTDNEDVIEDIKIESPLGKSDHALISLTMKVNRTSPNVRQKVLYDKGNYEMMREYLDVNWKEELDDHKNTPNKQWEILQAKINEAQNLFIPTKQIGNNQKQRRQLDRKTIKKIRRKERIWKLYLQTNDGETYTEYQRLRNQVRKLTRKAKKLQEKLIAKNIRTNPKKFWAYAQSKSKSKVGVSDLYNDETNSTLTNTDTDKAEVLSDFFASVFTKEDTEDMPTMDIRTEEVMENIVISEDMVKTKLDKLKTCKSPGPDKLHPRILKELSGVLAQPLSIIFNATLNTGRLPEQWKYANITAIFKKGDKKDPGNYRPVSLTCIVCKVLESIIRTEIIKHMRTNSLFSPKQYGFINGRSTVLQLLKVLDEWTEIIDNGAAVDVVYCDFKKAFDTVPHARLIHKLEQYGIKGRTKEWVKDFLSDRKQCVVVNGMKSAPIPVSSGIPQ